MNLSTFKKRWLSAFAAEVPSKDIKKYVLSAGNYIWHIFSWKLLPEDAFLVGDAARNAYNGMDKTGAVYIEPFGKCLSKSVTGELGSASSLESLTEVYVVSDDFSWTYIKTHENDLCGPYFCKKAP